MANFMVIFAVSWDMMSGYTGYVSFTVAHAERLYLLERGNIAMAGTPEELKGEEYVRKTYFGV